jgi:hypothetical protein
LLKKNQSLVDALEASNATAFRIAEHRNTYLRAATTNFSPIHETASWPQFSAPRERLRRVLDDFVGARVPIVEKALTRSREARENGP